MEHGPGPQEAGFGLLGWSRPGCEFGFERRRRGQKLAHPEGERMRAGKGG